MKRIGERGGKMIGILVVTHGKLAAGLRNSAEMLAGSQENVAYLRLELGASVDHLKRKYTTKFLILISARTYWF